MRELSLFDDLYTKKNLKKTSKKIILSNELKFKRQCQQGQINTSEKTVVNNNPVVSTLPQLPGLTIMITMLCSLNLITFKNIIDLLCSCYNVFKIFVSYFFFHTTNVRTYIRAIYLTHVLSWDTAGNFLLKICPTKEVP